MDNFSIENFQYQRQFPIITDSKKANEILEKILQSEYAVIGIDIEAAVEMSRFGILCLIQIAYNDQAFIFDMCVMNYKELKLKELFSRTKIIKVFHDCIEDVSILYHLCHIKEIKGIFDTQIAHRMISNDTFNYNFSKNSSISLAMLIKEYCGVEYEIKGEMHNLMSINPYLWKERPINEKLNFYAGNDVIYLPKIYNIICSNIDRKMIKNINVQNIFDECKKYLKYVNINLKIKNFNKTNIQRGTEIQGLIKNFQNYCVYIQLNIGYIGIVIEQKNVSLLKQNYSLGDIILFKVLELDKSKKRYILEISPNNINNKNKNLFEGLNVEEKSFYPKSYLKIINQNKEILINDNREEVSIFSINEKDNILRSKTNHF